jgi:hypothetical protein
MSAPGTEQPKRRAVPRPQLAEADIRLSEVASGFDPEPT